MVLPIPDELPGRSRHARDRVIGAVIAGLRIGVGGALLVAPSFAGRVWVGPHGTGPGARVFARAVGARDVALGLRILADLRADRSVVPALRLGVAADAADAVATLAAASELTTVRRIAMPLVASTVALLGALVTEEAEQAEDDADGAVEVVPLVEREARPTITQRGGPAGAAG